MAAANSDRPVIAEEQLLERKQAGSSKPRSSHAYLKGNFWPVRKEFDLLPCELVLGLLPQELAGGQYLRNGGNAYFPPEKQGQGYHFFDGDGMIHGVFFQRHADGRIVPCYVNKFVQTDVLLASKKRGSTLLPSIASIIAPISTYPINLLITLMRTTTICYLSALTRLSAANTTMVFHNRKLLATCESGPAMRMQAPELDTMGWEVFLDEKSGQGLGVGKQVVGKKLGNAGRMLEEWTTGHPKVCPVTGDLVFYGYNIFAAPFATYSVVRSDGSHSPAFKAPIPGITRPKMMHDFAVSLHHSVILDLPLTMDPLNVVLGRPMLSFNRALKSRFGILPRYYDGSDESQVRWFEDDLPSLIFHTADAWDEGLSGNQYCAQEADKDDELVAVNMYACRFRTSKLVYAAGGMEAPLEEEELNRQLSDAVRLTYYRFSMSPSDPYHRNGEISHAFSLSAIPFEFPVIRPDAAMRQHDFVYGCTLRSGAFDAALEGAKVDCIIKVNAERLRRRGLAMMDAGKLQKFEDVDTRTVQEVLDTQQSGVVDPDLSVFDLPAGLVGQEPSFVPRENSTKEDDGYLVFYVYDEAQLLANGDAPEDSKSQLWIIDAAKIGCSPSSGAVVGIVDLPARVPYGLHSNFITAEQIDSQLRSGNTNAEIIHDVVSTPADSEINDEVEARRRSETIRVADRGEQMERELECKARAGLDGSPDFALFLWFSAIFWAFVRQVDMAMYSERARALRTSARCVREREMDEEGDGRITRKRSRSERAERAIEEVESM